VSALRIEIFPDDLDLAASFYSEVLEFDVVRDERAAVDPYLALRRDDVRIGAAQRPTVSPSRRRPPVGVELVLEVEDLAAARQRVRQSGCPIDEDITFRPWGLNDFRILDPFGYYWRITDREPTVCSTELSEKCS
jgi:lactoylglutathione lyase